MAVMLARYLHFYPGYTAESVLRMPWRRFLALYGAIKTVQADDDLRALESRAVAAHPGEKGGQYRALVERLSGAAGRGKDAPSTLAPGVTPLAVFEAEPGSIEAERERQKAAAERLEAERARRRDTGTQSRSNGGGA